MYGSVLQIEYTVLYDELSSVENRKDYNKELWSFNAVFFTW